METSCRPALKSCSGSPGKSAALTLPSSDCMNCSESACSSADVPKVYRRQTSAQVVQGRAAFLNGNQGHRITVLHLIVLDSWCPVEHLRDIRKLGGKAHIDCHVAATGFAIQAARRFIAQDQQWMVGKGAGDGKPVAQPENCKQFSGTLVGFPLLFR